MGRGSAELIPKSGSSGQEKSETYPKAPFRPLAAGPLLSYAVQYWMISGPRRGRNLRVPYQTGQRRLGSIVPRPCNCLGFDRCCMATASRPSRWHAGRLAIRPRPRCRPRRVPHPGADPVRLDGLAASVRIVSLRVTDASAHGIYSGYRQHGLLPEQDCWRSIRQVYDCRRAPCCCRPKAAWYGSSPR